MNIAEKLTAIAENEKKVYEAGQKSMVDESKIIEKTASGKIISLNDVSEIPHEVGIVVQNANLINAKKINIGYEIVISEKIDARPNPAWYTTEKVEVSPNTEYLLSGTSSCARVEYDDMGNALAWYNPNNGASYTFITGDNTHYVRLNSLISGYSNPSLTRQTDLSGVIVKVCGKNLSGKKVINKYNYSLDYKEYNEENAIVLPKGTYCISGTPTPILQFFDVDSKAQLLVDEAVTFSGWYYKGWDGFALVPSADIYLLSVFSLKRTAIVTMCGQNEELTDVQIEVGTSKTTYEAPTEIKEYVSNASGVVDGITSMSPNMTVFTDNADVNITVKYHKSWGMQTEYDRFWDEVQNKGERMNYSYVFYGPSWNDITFKPKYDIKFSGSAAFAFARTGIENLEGILNDCGVVLATSALTNADNLFGTSSLVNIPELDFSNVTTSVNSCFINCQSLITVRKLKMSENTVTNADMFSGCTELKNIIFDGTIAKSGINLQWSTKLSRASIESLVGVYATDAVVSATLSKTAVNTAFETSDGAADGSNSAAWLALVARKPNLTISLV